MFWFFWCVLVWLFLLFFVFWLVWKLVFVFCYEVFEILLCGFGNWWIFFLVWKEDVIFLVWLMRGLGIKRDFCDIGEWKFIVLFFLGMCCLGGKFLFCIFFVVFYCLIRNGDWCVKDVVLVVVFVFCEKCELDVKC